MMVVMVVGEVLADSVSSQTCPAQALGTPAAASPGSDTLVAKMRFRARTWSDPTTATWPVSRDGGSIVGWSGS